MYLYPSRATRAVSAPKMTMPIHGVWTPMMRLTAWPDRTAPVEAKPMYMSTTSTSGMIAPMMPNWAREEIICGRPSCGPCAECSAMTIPPMMLPMSRPMIAHSASAPKTTARAPSTIAVI